MKKGKILILAVCAVFLTGCFTKLTPPEPGAALTEPASQESGSEKIGLANHWSSVSVEEAEKGLGIAIPLPAGAEVTDCKVLLDEELYEIDFDLDGLSYTYRLKYTDAEEDISGLYYDWSASMETPLGDFRAMDYRAVTDSETVDYIIWYDESKHLTRTLSTSDKDLNGFDITAVALSLIPGQGAADVNAAYNPVMEEILDVILNGYDSEEKYTYVSSGLMERANYAQPGEMKDSIGYYLADISGDGIPELIIGEDLQDYISDSGNTETVSFIYSIFTCKDGEPVQAVEGWARNSYRYLGDGRFFNQGSGGAMYTMLAWGHLQTDGTDVEWEDCYFSSDDGSKEGSTWEDIRYYHNTSGSWETADSEETDLDSEGFWALLEANKYERIPWTPAGDWK